MSISEYQLLNKLLTEKDYSIITDNLISDENFDQALAEFRYITKFQEQYNEVPDKETFSAKFPNFQYFEVSQGLTSIIDDIREKTLFKRAVEVFNKSAELFTEDANKGAQFLINSVEKLQPNYSFTCTDIIHDTSRYEEWKDRLSNADNYFIPSGFPELDEYTFGWKRKEEFVLIIARTGSGKSFVAVKSAEHALSLGYNVGFFSPEISASTLGYRFDSARAKFSNTALLQGALVNGYDDYIKDLQKLDTHFYVAELKDFHNSVTVPKLKYFCKNKNIDILFIDGFDYLEDTRAQKFHSREDRMGHIAQDLVTMSIELNIPVIGVIQANRKGSAEDDIDTTNITGADKIGASCTRLIALKNKGTAIEMSLPKNRYGRDKVKVLYKWEADRSQYFFIPSLEDIDDEEIKEAKFKFSNAF